MPKRSTGQVLKNADGLSARVRIPGHHPERPSFALAGCLTVDEAEVRAKALASWVREMKPHASPDEIAKLVRLGASAKDEQAFGDVAEAFAAIASGKTKGTVAALAPTFGKWAEEWTSGRLHAAFPDHVRDKDNTGDARIVRMHLGPIAFKRLPDVTLDDAEAVMKALPRELAPATRRQIAQCMRKVLSLAVYPGRHIPQNPIPREWMPRAKSATKAKTCLYPGEDAKLLGCKEVALERRMAYGVLIREGMRAGELERLKWVDVDLERGRVRLDENKTDDPRAWALSPDVTAALTWWKKRTKGEADDLVIGLDLSDGSHWLRGRAVDAKIGAKERPGDLRTAGVTRAELFERTATRQPLRLHDLRASFVTVSLATGKTEQWVSDRTGHKSSQMISAYARQARTWAELDVGSFGPMHRLIPECLEATKAKPARPRRMGSEWAPRVGHDRLELSANGLRVRCSTN
jgi:integrase